MSAIIIDQNFSIRIPRVFPNITPERITKVFQHYELGTPSKIEIIPKEEGRYNLAIVHFNGGWCQTQLVSDFQESVKLASVTDPQKLVYDGEWFWIIIRNIERKEMPTIVVHKPPPATAPVAAPVAAPAAAKQEQGSRIAFPKEVMEQMKEPEEENEIVKLRRENLELKKKLAEQEVEKLKRELEML